MLRHDPFLGERKKKCQLLRCDPNLLGEKSQNRWRKRTISLIFTIGYVIFF